MVLICPEMFQGLCWYYLIFSKTLWGRHQLETPFLKKKQLFIYLFLALRVFVAAWAFLQLRWMGATPPAAVQELLTVVACLATELRLCSAGSTVVVCRLNCSSACGILLDQGLTPCLRPWQEGSLPLGHQGSPRNAFYTGRIWTPERLSNLPKMPWQNWDSNTHSLVKSPNCFSSA